MVDEPVVWAAQEDQVGESGRTSISPVLDMMGIAPALRSIASRKPATFVTKRHRSSQRGGSDGRPPPDLEGLGRSPHDHSGDRCVARPPSCGFRRDRPGVVELAARPRHALERLEIHRHNDVWSLSGDDRPVGRVEPTPADLAECVGSTLSGRTRVGLKARSGVLDASQRCDQHLSVLGVEIAVHSDHALEGRRTSNEELEELRRLLDEYERRTR